MTRHDRVAPGDPGPGQGAIAALAAAAAPAPGWVPQDALRYLAHTEAGLPIRALARHAGCHASTVLRQIRRLENRRDDLLVDEALRRLGSIHFTRLPAPEQAATSFPTPHEEDKPMQTDTLIQPPHFPHQPPAAPADAAPSTEVLRREGRRVLRRLAEPGAVLAVAAEMDKAVVVRDAAGGTTRTAVVDRAVAQAMALKEWITCDAPGRISRYRITGLGRAALTTLMAEAENAARLGQTEGGARGAGLDGMGLDGMGPGGPGAGFPGSGFPGHAAAGQGSARQAVPGQAVPGQGADDPEAPGATPRRRIRYCMNESPLLALARRRDKAGKPFLSDDLVRAGERLREDFELAQMGPKQAQNWDRFLTAGVQGGPSGGSAPHGPEAARSRMSSALRDLGPGLGDVALRCCCYLEGLEQAERRMGWSARSGKIVLRIALQRLKRHYDDLGQAGAMIG
jgi:hypothetical protein